MSILYNKTLELVFCPTFIHQKHRFSAVTSSALLTSDDRRQENCLSNIIL